MDSFLGKGKKHGTRLITYETNTSNVLESYNYHYLGDGIIACKRGWQSINIWCLTRFLCASFLYLDSALLWLLPLGRFGNELSKGRGVLI